MCSNRCSEGAVELTEVAENTLVDGRYRVVCRIGSGGMADVYRAEDTHLGREVALKVLHRRFAEDAEFVERFRREAKAAAALQHPNVVGVFDRGEHDGTYYIAMERLAGRTLKEVIAEDAPLPQGRAIELAQQILAAAGFAHRRGVIHRDLKPHNVIVDELGLAKVTDFGIARAGASEMTQTGSILGTAQYLSPEQAQSMPVTAASDLYSVGVVLYELVAGRLPFEGDSAVAIAVKHLSEEPPPLSSLRPDVDPGLEAIVMAALAKDPEARWSSAEEFAAALEQVRLGLLADGNGGGDTAAWAALAPPPDAVAAEPEAPEPEPRRRRRWPRFTFGLLVLALVVGLVVLALTGLLSRDTSEVPRVVGLQLVAARAALERAGFEVDESRVRSTAAADTVLDQDPNAGAEAERGSTVTLEVSDGPGNVRVPSIEDLPRERAVKELNKVGLKVNLDEESSESVRSGFAIRTVPREGTEIERGTRVRLFVSSGPSRVRVPDVVGLSRSSAESHLRDEGLDAAVKERESDEPVGEVLAQSPAAGALATRGTRVTITVSKAREQVAVPSLVGLPAGEAVRALSAAGFVPLRRARTVEDEGEQGVVVDQSPAAGAELDPGASVTIFVGRYEAPQPPATTPTTTAPTAPAPPADESAGGAPAPEGR